MRGRVVVGSQAQGPGLANVVQGEKAGSNNTTVIANGTVTVSLSLANLPAHSHPATLTLDPFNASTHVTIGANTVGGISALANNGGLTATAGGPSSAAIYLPAGTAPTSPVNLGGVTTTVTGSGTVTTGNTGTGTPLVAPVVTNATVSNMQPYLGLNYIIAMQGIFPSRN